MKKRRKLGVSVVLSLFLLTASVGAASANRGAYVHSLSAVEESVAVGATGATASRAECDFAHGFALGLGISAMFGGCIPCATAGLAVEIAAYMNC